MKEVGNLGTDLRPAGSAHIEPGGHDRHDTRDVQEMFGDAHGEIGQNDGERDLDQRFVERPGDPMGCDEREKPSHAYAAGHHPNEIDQREGNAFELCSGQHADEHREDDDGRAVVE